MSREQKWSTFGERRRMGSNCRRDGSSATRSSASFAVVANSWFRRTWSNMCGGEAVNRIPNLATTGACQAARPAYEHQCPYEEPNVDSSIERLSRRSPMVSGGLPSLGKRRP